MKQDALTRSWGGGRGGAVQSTSGPQPLQRRPLQLPGGETCCEPRVNGNGSLFGGTASWPGGRSLSAVLCSQTNPSLWTIARALTPTAPLPEQQPYHQSQTSGLQDPAQRPAAAGAQASGGPVLPPATPAGAGACGADGHAGSLQGWWTRLRHRERTGSGSGRRARPRVRAECRPPTSRAGPGSWRGRWRAAHRHPQWGRL